MTEEHTKNEMLSSRPGLFQPLRSWTNYTDKLQVFFGFLFARKARDEPIPSFTCPLFVLGWVPPPHVLLGFLGLLPHNVVDYRGSALRRKVGYKYVPCMEPGLSHQLPLSKNTFPSRIWFLFQPLFPIIPLHFPASSPLRVGKGRTFAKDESGIALHATHLLAGF